MDIPRIFSEILWFIFSWIIWLLLKWRNWPRPSLSIMLIYSTAIGIFSVRSWQKINALLKIELIDTSFSIFRFLAGVSFWFIVIYVPVALKLKPKFIFNLRRNWWIALLVLTLAVWHILSAESVARIRDFIYFDLIITNISFYTVLGIFIPWIIWLLLGKIEQPRPSVPIMISYSISAANASFRLWLEMYVCKFVRYACEVDFSLPLFLVEVVLWFIPLYALMKLISKFEFGNKLVELVENHKGQPIGTE